MMINSSTVIESKNRGTEWSTNIGNKGEVNGYESDDGIWWDGLVKVSAGWKRSRVDNGYCWRLSGERPHNEGRD